MFYQIAIEYNIMNKHFDIKQKNSLNLNRYGYASFKNYSAGMPIFSTILVLNNHTITKIDTDKRMIL